MYIVGYTDLTNLKTVLKSNKSNSLEEVVFFFKELLCEVLYDKFYIDIYENDFVYNLKLDKSINCYAINNDIHLEISTEAVNNYQIVINKKKCSKGYIYTKYTSVPILTFFINKINTLDEEDSIYDEVDTSSSKTQNDSNIDNQHVSKEFLEELKERIKSFPKRSDSLSHLLKVD